MKTKFIFVVLTMTILSCKAQTVPAPLQIIPVENNIDYINNDVEIPDDTYFKDVNNILDKYVGTWIGAYDNKTYEFQIVEFTDNFLGITEDILLMRYKITDISGNIIESTLGLPDNSPYVIEGKYLSANEANYILFYTSQQPCNMYGKVYINVLNNGTAMNLFMIPDGDSGFGEDCPNGLTSIFPETSSISLTKQ